MGTFRKPQKAFEGQECNCRYEQFWRKIEECRHVGLNGIK
jgi:hypothetical protein